MNGEQGRGARCLGAAAHQPVEGEPPNTRAPGVRAG